MLQRLPLNQIAIPLAMLPAKQVTIDRVRARCVVYEPDVAKRRLTYNVAKLISDCCPQNLKLAVHERERWNTMEKSKTGRVLAAQSMIWSDTRTRGYILVIRLFFSFKQVHLKTTCILTSSSHWLNHVGMAIHVVCTHCRSPDAHPHTCMHQSTYT